MIDIFHVIFPYLAVWIVVIGIGFILKPNRTYPSGPSYKGLPDLRIAHLSNDEQLAILYKQEAEERARISYEFRQLEKQQYLERINLQKERYLKEREAAWKKGEPDVQKETLSEVREPRNPYAMPYMPRSKHEESSARAIRAIKQEFGL